jgi:hypothetical protein
MAGFFIAAGNTPSSRQPAMTLDTQMTLALLQELLLALRANDAEGFKGWMAIVLGFDPRPSPFSRRGSDLALPEINLKPLNASCCSQFFCFICSFNLRDGHIPGQNIRKIPPSPESDPPLRQRGFPL